MFVSFGGKVVDTIIATEIRHSKLSPILPDPPTRVESPCTVSWRTLIKSIVGLIPSKKRHR